MRKSHLWRVYNTVLTYHPNTRSPMDPETEAEIERLEQTVDDFAIEMKARLRDQAIKGYRGWDDPVNYRRITEMMIDHAAVSSGQEVDTANLAMILWYLRQREAVK